MKKIINSLLTFNLNFCLLTFAFLLSFSGCIRLSAKTGYWHQGADDETPQGKTVGFDTQDVVDHYRTPGSVQMGEE